MREKCNGIFKQIVQNSKMRSILIILFFFAMVSTGCTIKVPIAKPSPSQFTYTQQLGIPVRIYVIDARPEGEKKLERGVLRGGTVVISGMDKPMEFLRDTLVSELKTRGINAEAGSGAPTYQDALILQVERFYYRHHRATGYSPYVTFTNFRAKASYKEHPAVVTSYFHAGKVPVWSMSEIIEPTYNYPTNIIIKEIATKLNQFYFNMQIPDERVKANTEAATSRKHCYTITDVAFLGSSKALPHLEELAKGSFDPHTTGCAVNAIGIIGDPKSFIFLKGIYEKTENETVKLLALKAIGDIGTEEALQFVRSQPANLHMNFREVVELYTY